MDAQKFFGLLADKSPKRLWWLSFADGSRPKGRQFLGVALVEAPNLWLAKEKAWELGCNPGGSISGEVFEDDEIIPDSKWIGRLLSSDDVDMMLSEIRGIEGCYPRPN